MCVTKPLKSSLQQKQYCTTESPVFKAQVLMPNNDLNGNMQGNGENELDHIISVHKAT